MTRDEQMHFHLNAALTALRRVKRRPADIYTVKRNIEAAMMLLEPPRGPMRPLDDVISELGEEIEKMRRLIMAEVVRRLGPPVMVEDDEGEEA